MATRTSSRRGFAAMSPRKRKSIAAKGGHARAGRKSTSLSRQWGPKSTVSATTSRRGFAAMSSAKRKAIAAKGGRSRKSA